MNAHVNGMRVYNSLVLLPVPEDNVECQAYQCQCNAKYGSGVEHSSNCYGYCGECYVPYDMKNN